MELQELTKNITKTIMQNREALIASWIAETGIEPTEAVLCHQFTKGLVHKTWVERKSMSLLHRHPGEDEDWSSVYGPQYDVWSYIKLLQQLITTVEVITETWNDTHPDVLKAVDLVKEFETKHNITRSQTIR